MLSFPAPLCSFSCSAAAPALVGLTCLLLCSADMSLALPLYHQLLPALSAARNPAPVKLSLPNSFGSQQGGYSQSVIVDGWRELEGFLKGFQKRVMACCGGSAAAVAGCKECWGGGWCSNPWLPWLQPAGPASRTLQAAGVCKPGWPLASAVGGGALNRPAAAAAALAAGPRGARAPALEWPDPLRS